LYRYQLAIAYRDSKEHLDAAQDGEKFAYTMSIRNKSHLGITVHVLEFQRHFVTGISSSQNSVKLKEGTMHDPKNASSREFVELYIHHSHGQLLKKG
jgi:hypothetical protein